MYRNIVGFLVFGLFLFFHLFIDLSAQTHGTSPNWTVPTLIPKPHNGSNVSKGGIGQNIIRLSNGDLYQIYLENYPSPYNYKIYFSKSSDDGLTWNAIDIDTPFVYFNIVHTPTFAKDNNDNIHVIWITNVPTKEIYYAKFDKNLQLLIDTVKISQFKIDINDIGDPYITVDRNNKVHIMWNDGDAEQTSSSSYFSKVMYRQSPDGGLTWNNQIILSDTTMHKHAAFPRANFRGCSGDTLAIPWRQEVTASNWDVWMAFSTDGGVNWSRLNVANSDSAEWDPGIVVDKNNRIHLHYHEYKKGNLLMSSVEYKYTDNLGQNWSNIQTLSVPNMRSQLSIFSYDYSTDVQCICWKDERDFENALKTHADVMCSFSLDRGSTWQGQEFVNDLDTISTGFKSVEVGSNGVLYVTFEYTNPSDNLKNIYFTKRVSLTTSLENYTVSSDWIVYPNPASHEINILTPKKNWNIQIYDPMGVLIYEAQNVKKVDVSKFSAGIYLLKFKHNNYTDLKKIIIN